MYYLFLAPKGIVLTKEDIKSGLGKEVDLAVYLLLSFVLQRESWRSFTKSEFIKGTEHQDIPFKQLIEAKLLSMDKQDNLHFTYDFKQLIHQFMNKEKKAT